MGIAVSMYFINAKTWAVAHEQRSKGATKGLRVYRLHRYKGSYVPISNCFILFNYYSYFNCHLYHPSSGRIMRGPKIA